MLKIDTYVIRNGETVAKVHKCVSAAETGIGLLGTPELRKENGCHTGIIMPIPRARQKYTGFINSIHMIGMKYPIAVFWVDKDGTVVTKAYALPGFRIYSPDNPAAYVIELDVDACDVINVGDVLTLKEIESE